MKYFALIIFSCLSTVSISQTTLRESNTGLYLNFEYKNNTSDALHDVTNIDPSPAGANIIWDLSNLNVPIIEGVMNICVEPTNTPFVEDFPTANICIKQKDSINGLYQYILQTDSKSETLAFCWYKNGVKTITKYETGNTYLEFPTSFGSSYNDEFSYTTIVDGNPFMIDSATQTIEADAYGTVKTPYKTFDNTLRIKRTTNMKSYMNMGMGWTKTRTTVMIEYQWIKPGIPGAVISVTEFDGEKKYNVAYRASEASTSAMGENSLTEAILVYPNPAKEQLFIAGGELKILAYEIQDLNGRRIRHHSTEEHTVCIRTDRLSEGYYILIIKTAHQTFIRKIVLG